MYVLCKQGNDSQKAVQLLREEFCRNNSELLSSEVTACPTDSKQDSSAKSKPSDTKQDIPAQSSHCDSNQDLPAESNPYDIVFKDIAGGLYAWAKHIDKDFPVY